FVLSPPGLAPDCYRNWEALLVGSIPVVKTSQLDPLFKNLPVLIIENWEDLNEDSLNASYENIISKKYNISALYMEYWTSKIMDVRYNYLKYYKPS
ncbi:hypothetical protein H0X06_05190, partial [Candidatus Dependentiae bacterium]|nr:hypothetical protein [Candidatus Dependentiae bacterium]